MLLTPTRLTDSVLGIQTFYRADLRQLAFIVFALFLSSQSFAQCTGSSPTWTTTIDQSSVNTCISDASSGDTINVSSGSATWSSVTLPTTKYLTLACPSASCDVTVGTGVGDFAINANASGSTVVTGFSFTMSATGGEGNITLNLATGPPYDVAPRIYNNTFSTSGTAITVQGLGPYLIDHNNISTSTDAAETFHLWGAFSSNSTSAWTVDVVPGSANMGFIENNNWAISSPSSNYCQVEEADYGAVFVLRYNVFNGCQMDVHAGLGQGGGRWVEIYNNQYQNCCASGSAFDWRGGSGVYWGNTTTSPRSGTNMSVGPMGSDPTGSYPVSYQFGMGINGTNYSPNYIWGNPSSIQGSITNNDSAMVQIGSSYNSCSGLTESLCNAIVTTSQPSTLERCESAADVSTGCPVTYSYTPYTYPHPLDNCPTSSFGTVSGGCGTTPPSPPTGVKAVAH